MGTSTAAAIDAAEAEVAAAIAEALALGAELGDALLADPRGAEVWLRFAQAREHLQALLGSVSPLA